VKIHFGQFVIKDSPAEEAILALFYKLAPYRTTYISKWLREIFLEAVH